MNEIMTWIMELMRAHGPLSVFLGVIIESIIVPIPSPLIIMGAGALLITPGLPIGSALTDITLKIVIPASVASTIGAYLTYGVAYWGGKRMIDRYERFLGFDWKDVLRIEEKLKNKAVGMIFLMRAIPIVPLSLVSAAAGALRLPPIPFTWATFAGSLPRTLLLGWLGYLTRDSYEGLAGHVNRMESIVSALIVIGVMAAIIVIRRRVSYKDV